MVYTSCIGLGFRIPRERWMWALVAIVLCWCLANAVDIADYEEYSQAYAAIAAGEADSIRYPFGWVGLCSVGAFLGLPYNLFSALVMGACLFALNRFFLQLTVCSNLAWALFLIYPAALSCIQLRFFVAVVIGSFALLLLRRRSLNGYLLFALVIFAAMAFHTAALVFFIALPASFLATRQRGLIRLDDRGRFLLATIAIIPVYLVITNFADIFALILGERDASYLSWMNVDAVKVLRYYAVASICFYVVKKSVDSLCANTSDEGLRSLALAVKCIALFLIVATAFVVSTYNFVRFLRAFYLVLIGIVVAAYSLSESKRERRNLLIYGLCMSLAGVALDLLGNASTTLVPLLAAI